MHEIILTVAKTLLLTCGDAPPAHLSANSRIQPRLDTLDIYALEHAPWSDYAGLLIPMHVDQRFLVSIRHHLIRFLENNRTIVFCGQITYPFLPDVGNFVPVSSRSVDDYRVRRAIEHPVFAHVDTDHLTFRKGIAGFYGRGHMPAPPHAQVIHYLGASDTVPIDYVVESPHGGRMLIHAGNDLWNYATEAESSAHRIPTQLLDWIESFHDADNVGKDD